MDAFGKFLSELQDPDSIEKTSALEDGLSQLSSAELDSITSAVQNVDPEKVSHILPVAPQAPRVESGQYPHGLTQTEAELVNKVAAVDFAARQMARAEMKKSAQQLAPDKDVTQSKRLTPKMKIQALVQKKQMQKSGQAHSLGEGASGIGALAGVPGAALEGVIRAPKGQKLRAAGHSAGYGVLGALPAATIGQFAGRRLGGPVGGLIGASLGGAAGGAVGSRYGMKSLAEKLKKERAAAK